MAVDTTHAQYDKHAPKWQKLRDGYEGQEAVHGKGKLYLPRLTDQTDEEYKAYVARAPFYGATARTIDGLSGMLFRKPPQSEMPNALEPYAEDINLDGLSLLGFAEEVGDNILTVGRSGILVDHPQPTPNADGTPVTIAQSEAQNQRPFLKQYMAESIINWSMTTVNNITVLGQVRLLETVSEEGEKEFETVDIEQIRVLDLVDGKYQQRIYRKNAKTSKWEQFGDVIIPLKKGVPLDSIPFVFVGVKNAMPTVEKPPLIDLVNVNISHYQSTADLEHGAHFTGLPTAVITGAPPADAKNPVTYRIGSTSAWTFPNAETKASFLEFEGKGLESLEERIKVKEAQMGKLGARMLADEKRQVEAAETANIHRMGENSVLSSIAQSISDSITTALEIMADWAGISGAIKFELTRDFLPATMTPQMLQALMTTWQTGGMSFEDFLINLKKGELVAEDRTAEQIKQEVADENPFTDEDLGKGKDG